MAGWPAKRPSHADMWCQKFGFMVILACRRQANIFWIRMPKSCSPDCLLGTTLVKTTCGWDLLCHQATNNMEPKQLIPTTERGAKPRGGWRRTEGEPWRWRTSDTSRTIARGWSKGQRVFLSYTFTKNWIGWLRAVEVRDNETSTVATTAAPRSRGHQCRDKLGSDELEEEVWLRNIGFSQCYRSRHRWRILIVVWDQHGRGTVKIE